MDLSLKQILKLEDSTEKGLALLQHAEHKVKNYPDSSTDIENAAAAIWSSSLQTNGGDWHGAIFYNPNSKHWKGVIEGLNLMGYADKVPLFQRANELYWSPEAENYDWDDPPASDFQLIDDNEPVAEPTELQTLESQLFNFLADLCYEVFDLALKHQGQFTPIPELKVNKS